MACEIYIYICLKLTVPTEAHKLLQDGIKVSHGKAMMWKGDHCRPRPQTDILDHKWKKCSSDLNHLLPLLSAISPNDIPKFVFIYLFFLIRPRFPKPLVLLHVSYNHV